ncbi:MAG: zinc dependent phospholipase C family protein [Deltaproteobacteria bacterium]|nr:zinc dependent phospholipase C family protein [Deltaproteobacteria bacterium]
MIVSLFVFLGVLFLPSLAFAWGPITHISYGMEVLNNLSMLIPPLQELLHAFPNDYLYGCLAADITLKKDLVRYIHHCHNWDIGLSILERARSQKQKAFAYGYLSHLAADTISHNYYVPYHIVASFPTRTLKHVYWELRFDATRDQNLWKLPKKIVDQHHKSSHDQLLKGFLKPTLFSFGTNRIIFKGLMNLEHSSRWHGLVQTVANNSSWKLTDKDVQEFHSLATEAMFDFLNHGKKSKFYLIDPSGKLALDKAKKLRKELKHIYKRQPIRKTNQELTRIRKEFKKALFEKASLQRWVEVQ